MKLRLLPRLCLLSTLMLAPLAQAAPTQVTAEAKETLSALEKEALAAIPPLPKPVNTTFCMFDIAGASGDMAAMVHDLVQEAKKWNLFIDLKVYSDERAAAEEFKAGQCDIVALSTLRAKQFNNMVGSLDSPGNLPSYAAMKTLLTTLATPVMASLSINGRYQVAAIVPIGKVYVVVNDRQINSLDKAAGKRIVVLDWDKSQSKMISAIGAQPVPADLTNYGAKFNNGQADIIAAPAMAYKPLELYRGVGKKGGVIRFPLLQATATVLIRRDIMEQKIPQLDKRLKQLRDFGLAHIDPLFKLLEKADADIPKTAWIDLSPADVVKYQRMLREARIHMTREGVYEPTMMGLLKRVRCKHDPANEECSMFEE